MSFILISLSSFGYVTSREGCKKRREGRKQASPELMTDHGLHVRCERLYMNSHSSLEVSMGLYMVVLPASPLTHVDNNMTISVRYKCIQLYSIL